MQRLWKNGFEWDEVLPSDIIDSWYDIRDDIQDVTKNVKMSRHYFDGEIESENGQDKTVTLHVFVDASQKAYGASAYLCKGNICSLVLAKNRVAPLKKITLPKLELMAAVIGTRISVQLRQNLEIDRTVFWSDSQIVLYWISSTKSINKFVNSRVSEIKESTSCCEWKYVPTESNPADIQTRGISASQFKESTLWMKGPTWISDETTWPKWTPQLKQETTLLTTTDDYGHPETQDSNLGETTGISRIIDIKRFSTLNKLVRVTCYVLKFVKHCRIRRAYNFRRNRTHGLEIITDEEYQRSLGLWIKSVQNETFEREIDQIRTNSRNKELPMLRQLRLFIDDDDIVRCAGRIHNSTLDENTKFPILLPKKHELTDLIVWDAHLKMLHSGTGQTITQIRQSYWIPSIRQCVNHVIHKCVQCRKITGRAYSKPDSPPLPKDRVTEMIPFTTTGVDFAGPLYIKENGQLKKMYICLFTCACIRAVHLELVTDLSIDSFMLAFRRFISRRGSPSIIYSDNAPTFVSAAHKIPEKLNINVNWKFIPRAAPWYDGWWERLVGITKVTLKKVLGRSQVNAETLQTILIEVECVINDRPITCISSDIRDPEPLTPSHLLQGRRLSSTENISSAGGNPQICDSLEANKLLQRKLTLIEHFSKRWSTEYLTGLREYHRVTGHNLETHVKVGTVVLIMDNSPRTLWKLAVVVNVIKGHDGLIRAVELRTSNGLITTRPIVKLVPLEL